MSIVKTVRLVVAAFPCCLIVTAAIKYIGIPNDILLFTYLFAGFGISEILSWFFKSKEEQK